MTSKGDGRTLRTVNLAFPKGRCFGENERKVIKNNGFRPHGGYRGLNAHPPSPYSFNKSQEFHDEIQSDISEWSTNDSARYAPEYALYTSMLSTHSGESALFVNGLLAPNREGQSTGSRNVRNVHKEEKRKKQFYYRPTGKHVYLAATSWSEGSDYQSLESLKYGRPTRTSVLRARQRCHSAPVSRRGTRKDIEQEIEGKLNTRVGSTHVPQQLSWSGSRPGESAYGFLIGARYNRAHCLDARSAEDFGVYMPRNNPLGCFITKNKFTYPASDDEQPSPPPDSPMSQSDVEEEVYLEEYAAINKQAWSNESVEERYRKPGRERDVTDSNKHPVKRPLTSKRRQDVSPVCQVNSSDGLNITGKGVQDTSRSSICRPGSSRPPSGRPPSMHKSHSRLNSTAAHSNINAYRIRPQSAVLLTNNKYAKQDSSRSNKVRARPQSAVVYSGMARNRQNDAHLSGGNRNTRAPIVLIQGKSIQNMIGQQHSRYAIDKTSRANEPSRVKIPTGSTPNNPPPTPSSVPTHRYYPRSSELRDCGGDYTRDSEFERHNLTVNNGQSESRGIDQSHPIAVKSDSHSPQSMVTAKIKNEKSQYEHDIIATNGRQSRGSEEGESETTQNIEQSKPTQKILSTETSDFVTIATENHINGQDMTSRLDSFEVTNNDTNGYDVTKRSSRVRFADDVSIEQAMDGISLADDGRGDFEIATKLAGGKSDIVVGSEEFKQAAFTVGDNKEVLASGADDVLFFVTEDDNK